MQDFVSLVHAARTCRRFVEANPVSPETLAALVDCVRTTTSARNRQPLRYITISGPDLRAKIFSHLHWAGQLKEWHGPEEGERPTGYIVILSLSGDSMATCDMGIAAQTIQLHAATLGLGCCMINNFPRDPVREILAVPSSLEIMLVLALGEPKEKRCLTEAKPGDSLKYWRDDQQVHYVPKLTLDQVLEQK